MSYGNAIDTYFEYLLRLEIFHLERNEEGTKILEATSTDQSTGAEEQKSVFAADGLESAFCRTRDSIRINARRVSTDVVNGLRDARKSPLAPDSAQEPPILDEWLNPLGEHTLFAKNEWQGLSGWIDDRFHHLIAFLEKENSANPFDPLLDLSCLATPSGKSSVPFMQTWKYPTDKAAPKELRCSHTMDKKNPSTLTMCKQFNNDPDKVCVGFDQYAQSSQTQ
ncbi:hypothetical protein PRZ48_011143 [Zasmidium cellare]|uniref:Uncharacterized protein n=1 Tax=Zasmidium cellare TaxID=395010 RepID=A0ABR0EAK3_ZASCE|nr:hypothetical protein PRZ48_011143 [Zasmidium cellare]